MKDYKHEALKELADQQVRFAPPPRRLEQLKRAEQLLTEIDPDRAYPYQFLCYRITEMANSLPAIPVEEVAEPVLTIEQISKKLNVTTKTIHRWRKRSLIGIP